MEECLTSFIVITHDRQDLLLACLRSVSQQAHQPAEIIVVDNASTDGTAQAVAQGFPQARIIILAQNSGVAGGRNVGIEAARGDALIFIDDDAEFVSPEAASIIVSRFAAEPDLGAIAFRSINAYAGQTLGYDSPLPDLALVNQEMQVTHFVGVGFALRRTMLQSTGLFFAPFFFASEELDLCYRILEAGFRLLYLPSVVVCHHKPLARGLSAPHMYYGTRSRFLLAARNLPWWAALSYVTLWCGFLFLQAIREGLLDSYLRGMVAGLAALPLGLRTRKAIGRQTIRKLRALSGRLLY